MIRAMRMMRARTVQAPDLGGCLQRLRVAAGGPAAETAAKTIAKLLENIAANPEEPKFRKVKKTNKAIQVRRPACPACRRARRVPERSPCPWPCGRCRPISCCTACQISAVKTGSARAAAYAYTMVRMLFVAYF